MSNVFDIGVIGMGIAGCFACHKLAKDHKDMKVIGFDLGRGPAKRRRQLEGWLGCFPNTDGKLYQTDLTKIADIVGLRRAKAAAGCFNDILSNIDTYKVIKDKGPSITAEKRLSKIGYKVVLNDYIQMYPKDIHLLSKLIAETVQENENMTFTFDNEVKSIYKQKNVFVIVTENAEYRCKKIILAVGRSGWRWAKEIYSNFGIIENNDYAKFGIRIETNSPNMKEFNKSNCTLLKENEIEIGPLSWYGTIIPEDHVDVAISSFRSNENRWKSDKVSFNLIGNIPFVENGFEQTDRISKLTFVLSNDRIIKERISTIVSGKSKISIIPEYDWLKKVVEQLDEAIPDIVDKAYFHVPTISPMAPKVLLGTNLESEVQGMFIAGESMGVQGIYAAGISGIICADAACK